MCALGPAGEEGGGEGEPSFSSSAAPQPTENLPRWEAGVDLVLIPTPLSSSCGALGIHAASLKLSFLIC